MNLTNKHVFLTTTKEINQIGQPLREHLDIPIFAYVKINRDDSVINLHSNFEIIHNYYTKKLYQKSTFFYPINKYHSGFVLWSSLDTHPTILKTRQRFKAGQGITLINKLNDAVEFFHFAGDLSNQKLQNVFINNLDLLERFTKYFKQKAATILKQAEKEKIYIPELLRPAEFSSENALLSPNKKSRERFANDCVINPSKQLLSKREKDCIQYLMEGMTTKAIAQNFDPPLSPRTVEHYIDNVKCKLRVSSKYELMMKMRDELQ